MTVCIAAHSFPDKCIIVAADMMISTVDMSSDLAAIKQRAIGRHWVAQYAGDELSPVTPIFSRVNEQLSSDTDSLQNVADAFIRAYRHQLRIKAENEVLQPVGYTLSGFRKRGLAELGPETFSQMLFAVQQQRLGLEILVSGFEGDNAHIFTITSPGKITHYSEIGFWAIGSGQTNALGSFFNSVLRSRLMDKTTLLYRVCESKFNAETATGVGPTTSASILYTDGSRTPQNISDIEALKILWKQTKNDPVPEHIKLKAAESIANSEQKRVGGGKA